MIYNTFKEKYEENSIVSVSESTMEHAKESFMQMTRTREKPSASRATLLVSGCTGAEHSITFVIAGKKLERALAKIQKCDNYSEITVIWRQRTPPSDIS